MSNTKKRYTKKNVYQEALKTSLLLVLVLTIAYFIFQTDMLTPSIDKVTTSYISFNDTNKTDMIKLSNLEILSDKVGKSRKNKSKEILIIEGNKNDKYEIVLYHLGNNIDDAYVKYYLKSSKGDVLEGILKDVKEEKDGGKIIFSSTIEKNKEWTIQMWIINNDITKSIEATNISYEVRIK